MSFQVALSGLNAASTELQVTSNNLANASTTGFKESRAEFADVFSGEALGIGNGVRLADVRQEFTQGNVDVTGRQLDLAVSGNGFFVVNKNGSQLYSRVGAFGVDSSGFVQNSVGERLQVYPAKDATTFDLGRFQDLQLTTDTSPPIATTGVDMAINLPSGTQPPFASPFDPNDPATYNQSTSTVAYDSKGVAHSTRYYFSKTAAGWDAHITIDGNFYDPTAQSFTFDASGKLATPANGILTFAAYTPVNGALPFTANPNLLKATEYGSEFVVNSIRPDGQAAGRLRSVEVESTGSVFARFSNGQSTALGKVALANFSNPEGLLKVSDTSFQETFSSGVAQPGQATLSDFGAIQSGSLEASNVDLTAQLVKMITAQRLFQANAQVISTLDNVTQTIINIR
jgi:flagellar hook protein FlgE